MTLYKHLLFAGCVLMAAVASGRERTPGEMLRLAGRQLEATTTAPVSLLQKDGALSVYGNRNGFVVMTSDDRYDAVLGYSNTAFNPQNMPDGLRWWLRAAAATVNDPWRSLERMSTRAGAPVEPFIKTTWDQGHPYNVKCPKVGNDFPPTGCVATALAQVLKYYEYPATAKIKGSYTINKKTTNKTVTTTYKWENMKDQYSESDGQFTAPVTAVAELMRDCGYACDMTYAKNGSATSDIYAALALKDFFKYDSLAVHYYSHELYTDEEWASFVYDAIARKQPVLFGGADEYGGGHEFLLCGQDASGKVYVNWGWGGTYDGFFNLDLLEYRGNVFSYNQSIVTGLRPQATPDEQDHYLSQWVCDSIHYEVLGDTALILNPQYLFNYSVLQFDGTIDMAVINRANPSNIVYLNAIDTKDDSVGIVQPFYGWIFVEDEADEEGTGEEEAAEDGEEGQDAEGDTLMVSGFQDLAPGIYDIYLTSKEVRDSERQPVRTLEGPHIATLKKLSDGRLLVADEKVDDIADALRTPLAARQSSTDAYTLGGRRLSKPTQRGVYIVNGRKVIR